MAEYTFRRSTRHETRLSVRCKRSRGGMEAAWLVDLSPVGCQVVLRYGRPVTGEAITILPVGLERIAGVVRWTRGECARVEFAVPLHPAVAEHLAKSPFVEDSSPRRGEFGNAEGLGRRLLPRPPASVLRSVA